MQTIFETETEICTKHKNQATQTHMHMSHHTHKHMHTCIPWTFATNRKTFL